MERESFKKHTTRRVVFRLDFLPLEEATVDKIRTELMSEFIAKKKHFNTYGESFANRYEVSAPKFEAGSIEDSRLVMEGKLASSEKTYEYYQKTDGIVSRKIALSRSFLGLEINQDYEYKKFEDYESTISEAIKIINGNAKDTLILQRCGLRKLNDIKFKPEAKIDSYLNKEILGASSFNTDKISTIRYSNRYVLKTNDGFEVNYAISNIAGQFDATPASRVSFDIDCYTYDRNFLENMTSSSNELDKLNSTIFNFFVLTLNQDFAKKLTIDDELKDDYILGGVFSNGD